MVTCVVRTDIKKTDQQKSKSPLEREFGNQLTNTTEKYLQLAVRKKKSPEQNQ